MRVFTKTHAEEWEWLIDPNTAYRVRPEDYPSDQYIGRAFAAVRVHVTFTESSGGLRSASCRADGPNILVDGSLGARRSAVRWTMPRCADEIPQPIQDLIREVPRIAALLPVEEAAS